MSYVFLEVLRVENALLLPSITVAERTRFEDAAKRPGTCAPQDEADMRVCQRESAMHQEPAQNRTETEGHSGHGHRSPCGAGAHEDWVPTLMAAVGESNVTERLLKG